MKILFLVFFVAISSICLGQTFDTIKVVDNRRYGRPAGGATYHLRNRRKDTVYFVRYLEDSWVIENNYFTKVDKVWQMRYSDSVIVAGNFKKNYSKLFSFRTIIDFFNLNKRTPMLRDGWWVEYDKKGVIVKKTLYDKNNIIKEEFP